MKLFIYGHGGSANHGNEAIVRGIRSLFPDDDITLYSFLPDADKKFGLDKVCNIKPMVCEFKRYSLSHITCILFEKITNNRSLRYKYRFKPFLKDIDNGGVYLLEAGDQYCEHDRHREMYAYLNKMITKRGGKTVMLGCTVNEEFLDNINVIDDLKRYSLIIARESITHNALINAGITKNTKLAPCPAFSMESDRCELPSIFNIGDVVGINVGFLAQGNEKYYNLLVENCVELTRYIMSSTEYNVALIPHVNWSYEHSDFKTLELINICFKDTNRVEIVPEHNAPQQKYIMSKCRFMIALRTHVSVSSIASMVPTLVTGYKVKSTGIVRDIFPERIKLLAHIQLLRTPTDFVKSFIWMQENENEIRDYMKTTIPDYINKLHILKEEISSL